MNSVVVVAYGFPPEGSAGAYRPLRFVRHLPGYGWAASVISAAPLSYERYDPGLLSQVPSGTDVRRVACRDPWQIWQARRAQRAHERARSEREKPLSDADGRRDSRARVVLREMVRRAEAWWYHPDMAMSWIRPAVDATVEMVGRRRASVIWATAGPVSSFIVARRASQIAKVPYVLDFRDAWTITYNDFEARRPAWAVRADRRALYRLLKGAQAVTFRYHAEAECFWRAYSGALAPSRIHIIPNGYDGSIDETAIPHGDKCTMLYAGTLSSYRYDSLLKAIQWMSKSDAPRAALFRLVLVGEGLEGFAAEAAELGVSDMVATAGPMCNADVERLQREAHALLILGRPATMVGYELFAGAKLFSYLQARRPIVGVLPRDETKRILQGVGVHTLADVDSRVEIVAVLQKVVDAWSTGTLASLLPNRDACETYSAERQTAALVRALEGRPAVERFVPHAVEVPPSLRELIQDKSWASAFQSIRT